MNANLNTYFGRHSEAVGCDSDSIRKKYLAKARKQELLSAVDSVIVWHVIFALKILGGIICAVSFFAILGMIEGGKLSAFSGILCTVLVTLLECICFIPIGKRPVAKGRGRSNN